MEFASTSGSEATTSGQTCQSIRRLYFGHCSGGIDEVRMANSYDLLSYELAVQTSWIAPRTNHLAPLRRKPGRDVRQPTTPSPGDVGPHEPPNPSKITPNIAVGERKKSRVRISGPIAPTLGPNRAVPEPPGEAPNTYRTVQEIRK